MRNATATIKRCSWVSVDDLLMLQYHDREWGVPVHDDRKHFEFLVLEAAQAGLSWTIVLKKRGGYTMIPPATGCSPLCYCEAPKRIGLTMVSILPAISSAGTRFGD